MIVKFCATLDLLDLDSSVPTLPSFYLSNQVLKIPHVGPPLNLLRESLVHS